MRILLVEGRVGSDDVVRSLRERVVGRLWHDPTEYGELSRRAAEMARHPQVQPENVAAQFLPLIGSVRGR